MGSEFLDVWLVFAVYINFADIISSDLVLPPFGL